MSNGNQPIRVQRLADLARLPPQPVGSAVYVAEENAVYFSVGNLNRQLWAPIGWQFENVWMPDHVHSYLLSKRRAVFTDIFLAAAGVLEHPRSIHEDRVTRGALYLFADGRTLRELGVLRSKSTPFVDAVLELRDVAGTVVPRLFHLSPRNRNRGGRRIWP
jgi:hypothetical protein